MVAPFFGSNLYYLQLQCSSDFMSVRKKKPTLNYMEINFSASRIASCTNSLDFERNQGRFYFNISDFWWKIVNRLLKSVKTSNPPPKSPQVAEISAAISSPW